MAKDDHPFFIRVNTPDMLRVSLLESSKLILHSLQAYYKISTIRKTKKDMIKKLKSEVKELILLLGKLETLLPYQEVVAKQFAVTQAQKKAKAKPKRSVKNAEKEVVKSTEDPSFSELDKLNKALASIEEKLNSM